MKKAIYPGSFDPLTCGHLDIIERSVRLFDRVIIAIITNPSKQSLFAEDERKEMIENIVGKRFKTVEVEIFHGLLVDYAIRKNADVIVRGVRAIADYEFELQMAHMNRRMAPSIETILMMASEQYSYVSSHLVKEVASLGGSVAGLVPPAVERKLRKKQQNA